MAGKTVLKKQKKRRIGAWIACVLLLCALLFVSWMFLSARTLHVRYAEVTLKDLPASFDNTRILYASDIDLCGVNSVQSAARLFEDLQALNPDMLLLGGDYSSPGLFDRLNGSDGPDAVSNTLFFKLLKDFRAPMGKFAISGDNDGSRDSLALCMMDSGVALIDGTVQVIANGSDRIGIAGVGHGTENLSSLAANIDRNHCVIALAHSPEQLVDMRIAEAAGGGAWADLVLCGHTHGGQILLGERPVFSLTETESRYMGGWYTDAPSPLLVTTGVGCEAVNLRLGTSPEVWLITLKAV